MRALPACMLAAGARACGCVHQLMPHTCGPRQCCSWCCCRCYCCRLTIYGSGFPNDRFSNSSINVMVGPYPCYVLPHLTFGSVVRSCHHSGQHPIGTTGGYLITVAPRLLGAISCTMGPSQIHAMLGRAYTHARMQMHGAWEVRGCQALYARCMRAMMSPEGQAIAAVAVSFAWSAHACTMRSRCPPLNWQPPGRAAAAGGGAASVCARVRVYHGRSHADPGWPGLTLTGRHWHRPTRCGCFWPPPRLDWHEASARGSLHGALYCALCISGHV